MDKQEVIEKLKEYGAWCTECHDIHGEKDRYVKVAKVRELLEQLDEPQKVKVKQFVAEWYEEHKHNLSNSLWEFTVELNEKTLVTGAIYTEFESWFIDHPRAYEVITSMENGYEVEEEPKWVVKSNKLYFTGITQLTAREPITYNFTTDEKRAHVFDDKESAEKEASFFDGAVEQVEV